MGVTDTYRVNEPTVIHQTIGGETVIIHLASGLYYNLEGSGADIWERLGRGETPTAISAEIAGPAPADRDLATDEIDAFVRRLVEEDLLVAAPEAQPPDAAGPTAGHAPAAEAFRTPRVTRYDDLQDLLLLDPIHATDETGWPERAPAGVGTDRA